MSKFDEMREDYRLARLNNGAFRVVFILVDVVKGLLKVAALGCFALGIWYLLYGYESRPISSLMPGSQPEPATAAAEEASDLSAEQVAMLKEFAAKNRRDGVVTGQDNSLSVATIDAPTGQVNEESPRVFTDLQAVADPITDNINITPVEQGAGLDTEEPAGVIARLDSQGLDTSARSVFDNLQRRLEEDNAAGETADSQPATPELVVENDFLLLRAPVKPVDVQSESSKIADETADNDAIVSLVAVEVTAGAEPVATETDPVISDVGVVVRDERWMLAQSADAFLIQIGSTTNLPFLERFEKQLPDSGPTAIFEMMIGTRPEYVLTFGRFGSKEAAIVALGRLTQVARKYGAYVRPYSAVQQQIRDLGKDLAVAQQQVVN